MPKHRDISSGHEPQDVAYALRAQPLRIDGQLKPRTLADVYPLPSSLTPEMERLLGEIDRKEADRTLSA